MRSELVRHWSWKLCKVKLEEKQEEDGEKEEGGRIRKSVASPAAHATLFSRVVVVSFILIFCMCIPWKDVFYKKKS